MENKKQNIFDKINNHFHKDDNFNHDKVILTTKDKDEYISKKAEMQKFFSMTKGFKKITKALKQKTKTKDNKDNEKDKDNKKEKEKFKKVPSKKATLKDVKDEIRKKK